MARAGALLTTLVVLGCQKSATVPREESAQVTLRETSVVPQPAADAGPASFSGEYGDTFPMAIVPVARLAAQAYAAAGLPEKAAAADPTFVSPK